MMRTIEAQLVFTEVRLGRWVGRLLRPRYMMRWAGRRFRVQVSA